MAGWRIAAFDRARGRGRIASGVGTLEFDASVALVDDFRVGEEVDVTLVARGASFDVASIQPHGFRAPFDAVTASAAPALAEIFEQVRGRCARIERADEDFVALEVDDDTYRPRRRLVFERPCFVAAPMEIEIAALHAFDPAVVARAAPALATLWPRLPDPMQLFRLDPPRFGEGALLVIARSIALVSDR